MVQTRGVQHATVKKIKELIKNGVSVRKISKMSGVSKTTVMNYKKGQLKKTTPSTPIPNGAVCYDCQRGFTKHELGEYCLDLFDEDKTFKDKMSTLTNGNYLNGFPDYLVLYRDIPIRVIECKRKSANELSYTQGLWLEFFFNNGVPAFIQFNERDGETVCFNNPWEYVFDEVFDDSELETIEIKLKPPEYGSYCPRENKWLSEKQLERCMQTNCKHIEKIEKNRIRQKNYR